MTCIIGYTKNGITWMGGDSLGSNGYTGDTYKLPKVFHSKDTKDIVMGFTSSFRMGQLLTYSKDLFDELSVIQNKIDYEYLVTKFVPKLQRLFSEGGYERVNNNVKSSGEFLLGHQGRLFKIQEDYSVLESSNGYDACGCGEYFALGALKIMEENTELSPVEKIHKALQAASKFSVGVAPPFHIINTENDVVFEFEK